MSGGKQDGKSQGKMKKEKGGQRGNEKGRDGVGKVKKKFQSIRIKIKLIL